MVWVYMTTNQVGNPTFVSNKMDKRVKPFEPSFDLSKADIFEFFQEFRLSVHLGKEMSA